MIGINLDKPMEYVYASFRYFEEGEKHTTRICKDDVLLLVFDGILAFTEDGVDVSVGAGEYYIQKKGGYQTAKQKSESPKYLYVHFRTEWGSGIGYLPRCGRFDIEALMPTMKRLDSLSHAEFTYTEQVAEFYSILSSLYRNERKLSLPEKIAKYIAENYRSGISLEQLSEKLYFSKNHVINVFKKAYGCTPVDYMNNLRLTHAERLLKTTADTAESIALICGFADYSCLYKLFTKKHGISPAKWRREN